MSVGRGGNLIGGGVMLPWLIGLVELILIIKIYFGLLLKIPLKSEFFLINYKRLLFLCRAIIAKNIGESFGWDWK